MFVVNKVFIFYHLDLQAAFCHHGLNGVKLFCVQALKSQQWFDHSMQFSEHFALVNDTLVVCLFEHTNW